eukprot:464715_1
MMLYKYVLHLYTISILTAAILAISQCVLLPSQYLSFGFATITVIHLILIVIHLCSIDTKMPSVNYYSCVIYHGIVTVMFIILQELPWYTKNGILFAVALYLSFIVGCIALITIPVAYTVSLFSFAIAMRNEIFFLWWTTVAILCVVLNSTYFEGFMSFDIFGQTITCVGYCNSVMNQIFSVPWFFLRQCIFLILWCCKCACVHKAPWIKNMMEIYMIFCSVYSTILVIQMTVLKVNYHCRLKICDCDWNWDTDCWCDWGINILEAPGFILIYYTTWFGPMLLICVIGRILLSCCISINIKK